jgi:hypothetical protein
LPAQRAILGATRDVATVTAGVGVGVSGGGGQGQAETKVAGGVEEEEWVGDGRVGEGGEEEGANLRISGMQTGVDALSGVLKP